MFAVFFLFKFDLLYQIWASFWLRKNEITMKLLIIQTFLAVATKQKPEMMSYLNNSYDVMNYFAKFEKFLPHTIIIPSFMTVGSQMPELGREGGFFAPHIN